VIRPLDQPIAASGGTAILYGNLAPDGCVIKPPAAEARLLQHTGPAIVFDTYDGMSAAVKNPDLDVTPDHIMVFRNGGPIGGPGMPEWGMLPLPKKLLARACATWCASRCAHERHELRRLHPPRLAGGPYRRARSQPYATATSSPWTCRSARCTCTSPTPRSRSA
jgi:dihydroxy-acid dehydratase